MSTALGQAIGGGLGLGMSAAQMAMTKRAQIRAQGFTKHNYQHRYQWAVEDMRKAGINPMLAFASGTGQPQPSGGAGAGSFQARDGAESAKTLGLLNKQATNISRDSELKWANTQDANARTAFHENAAKRESYAATTESHRSREAAARADLAELQMPSARANAWLWEHPEMRQKILLDAGLDTAHRAKSLLPWWAGGSRGRMSPGKGPLRPGKQPGGKRNPDLQRSPFGGAAPRRKPIWE